MAAMREGRGWGHDAGGSQVTGKGEKEVTYQRKGMRANNG
jgi:hypothetical protein